MGYVNQRMEEIHESEGTTRGHLGRGNERRWLEEVETKRSRDLEMSFNYLFSTDYYRFINEFLINVKWFTLSTILSSFTVDHSYNSDPSSILVERL